MLQELKKLTQETAVYGLSTVVARLLNFLLLPLYTHYLLPAEYGVVATVFSYLAFLNVVYGHGMDFAFMRHFDPQTEESASASFSTAFWSLAATSLTFSALIYVLAGPLSRACGIPVALSDLTRYSAWILFFDTVALVPFAALRMTHRASLYASIRVINILVNLSLNFILVASLGMGVRGVFLASLLTSSATFAILTPVFIPLLAPLFRRTLHKELIAFALPLLPAGLASMMVQVIDRPILKYMTDDATVGLYQANYRLGILMMMVVNMFDASWRPFFLQRANKPGAGLVFGRVLTYWVAFASFLLVIISLFATPAVTLPLFAGRSLIARAYWPGLSIVPVVTLGYLFNGVYINMLVGPTLAKKSSLVAMATALGAAVNIGANFWWIPLWGLMGAAAATLAAYAAMAASLCLMSRGLYPIDYEPARLIKLAGVICLLAGLALAFGVDFSGTDRLWLRLGLALGFPLLLGGMGFFNEEERRALRHCLNFFVRA